MSLKFQGQVISFYQKYGFVKVLAENQENIYINLSNIKTLEEQENVFLVPGEYVEFEIKEEEDKREAINLTGVKSGSLMCENKHLRSSLTYYRRRMKKHKKEIKKETE